MEIKKRPFIQQLRKSIPAYALVIPAMVVLAVILIYPTLANIYHSFWEWRVTSPDNQEFVGFANYVQLFTEDHLFWQALVFTLKFLVFTLIVELLLGFVGALLLNSLGNLSRLITPILIMPYMTARLATGLVWRLLWARDHGLLPYLLGFIGLGDINWLGNSQAAFYAVAIPEIWRSMPFMLLILLAGLTAIPVELLEAAKVDGASGWQSFRHVMLPLLLPSISVGLIFQSIFKLRVFDIVFIMTGGGPGSATLPLGILIQRYYLRYLQGGYSAALSVVLLIMGAGFAYFYMRVLVRDV
jgi:multiple sugar transport system permease protein